MKTNGNNDWVAYRALVLTELGTAKEERKEISHQQVLLRLDVKGLKVRAAMWSVAASLAVSGVVGAIVTKISGMW